MCGCELVLVRYAGNTAWWLQVFFEDTVARRRLAQLEWEKTPVSKVFMHRTDMQMSVQHVQKMAVMQLLQHRNIRLWEAFDLFDTSKVHIFFC
jgi:hypothetical protein